MQKRSCRIRLASKDKTRDHFIYSKTRTSIIIFHINHWFQCSWRILGNVQWSSTCTIPAHVYYTVMNDLVIYNEDLWPTRRLHILLTLQRFMYTTSFCEKTCPKNSRYMRCYNIYNHYKTMKAYLNDNGKHYKAIKAYLYLLNEY